MRAIHEAAHQGRAVELGPIEGDAPPVPAQEVHVPPHGMPRTVAVESPSK